MLLDTWVQQTSCSAITPRVKELCCYLTTAQLTQARGQRLAWKNVAGVTFPLSHAKVVSLSAIITGDPGSYKSEAVRLIKKVITKYNEMCLSPEHLGDMLHPPISIYPHDKVTSEMMLSTLAKQSNDLPEDAPTTSTILVDELINFLNRREYVAHLIGDLNSLLDQPTYYSVGTQKRQTEKIRNPIVSLVAACAPSWFKYLPEALFTGGFTGRCMFYSIPYPTKEERQPLGQAVLDGGTLAIAKELWNLPTEPLVLPQASINLYKKWEMEFGEQRIHPLQAVDEWFKRRAIMAVRLAAAATLSHGEVEITPHYMELADDHMKYVLATLEAVWEELDSDDSLRFRILATTLQTREAMSDRDLMELAVDKMKSTGRAIQILQYMKAAGIIKPVGGGKWQLK